MEGEANMTPNTLRSALKHRWTAPGSQSFFGALFIAVALLWVGAQAETDDVGSQPPMQPPNAQLLLRQFDDLYESSGATARFELTIVRPRKTRTMRMHSWSKGTDKALVVVEAPARDAGTATLKVDQNLWNYLPKISRTIRIPPSMMMNSWMGTDLTNDDIVRDSSYEADYISELVGPSEDPPGWAVQLEARPDAVGLWSRVEMVFGYDHHLPIYAQFFDRKDRLSRTMEFSEIKKMGGRLIPTVLLVVPEREEGQYTELKYLDAEFDVDVDESMFSLAQLERNR
jgi:hypothetical protein